MGVRCIQLTALLLCNLAAVSLGLGVANVIAVNYFIYQASGNSPQCQPNLSNTAVCPYRNIIVLAFIGSGIWGSLAVFAIGVLAIRSIKKTLAYRPILQTASFVTAVVILPAMIVLNAINAALVTNENAPSALWNSSLSDSNTVQGKVLLALPICVSGVGFLEMAVLAGLVVYSCVCFKQPPPSSEPTEVVRKPAESTPPPQPQPQPQPAPETQPPAGAMEMAYPAVYPPGFGPAAYSPYGPVPYRRPIAFGGAEYGRLDPTSIYRPALRSPYMYPPGAGRYPVARPYPLSYVPPGY